MVTAANISGSIALTIRSWNLDLEVSDNTDVTVAAVLDGEQVQTFLAKASDAGAMTVTVGKAKPFPVSLVGSAKALNAFRTCAGIPGGGHGGGQNPFK